MLAKFTAIFSKWYDKQSKIVTGLLSLLAAWVGYKILDSMFSIYSNLKFTNFDEIAAMFKVQIILDILILIMLLLVIFGANKSIKKHKRVRKKK